jgi:CBS domain-containing protein
MQLKEFVNSRVETVSANDTIQLAAEKMRDLDVGSLPVCDGDKLVGIITDRDIAIRAVAEGSDPAAALVSDAMTPEVLWCSDTEDVEEAARIMREHQIRRLLVVNDSHELVGITSLGELATVTGNRLLGGETLEAVSAEPAPSESDLESEETDNDTDLKRE